MITGRDFVVLSDDFHGLPTSAIHLFRRLGRGNRVFWFNTIGRFPRLCLADAGKVLRTLGSWIGKKRGRPETPVGPGPGVRVVSPVMLPWFKWLGRRFNRRRFLRTYAGLCEEHGIVDPVLVTTFPYAVDFLKAVPNGVKIYYCVDDFLDYPGVNHGDWARMEAELLDQVDGLMVTSRGLARKQTRDCPLVHLPHGVDFDHFHEALADRRPVAALEQLPRPIVGFFGLISSWVDLGLIRFLSEQFPRVSFALLGRAEVDLAPLAGRPNVFPVGFIPYAELPRHARYFDVGLIPFVLNRLTRAVNPLKLLEYFALGLPVLSTRLPELVGMEGPLRLAVSREEFRTGLRALLEREDRFEPEDAFDAARQNTWDERVEQLSEFLERVETARDWDTPEDEEPIRTRAARRERKPPEEGLISGG